MILMEAPLGVPFYMRTFSSAGQSNRLITGRPWVRVPECPLALATGRMRGGEAWQEHQIRE